MSTEEKTETIYVAGVDTPGNYVREPADAHPPLDYPPYKSTALRHPKQPLIYLPQRSSRRSPAPLSGRRECGPPAMPTSPASTRANRSGERITLSGRVFDTGASRCATR